MNYGWDFSENGIRQAWTHRGQFLYVGRKVSVRVVYAPRLPSRGFTLRIDVNHQLGRYPDEDLELRRKFSSLGSAKDAAEAFCNFALENHVFTVEV